MGGRRRRSGYSLLAAFLAAAAKLLGLMRTLDPDQGAAGRSQTGRCRRVLDNHRCGSPDRRRRGFASFNRLGLAPDYIYRALDRPGGIAAVQALGGRTGTVGRVPDGGVSQPLPGDVRWGGETTNRPDAAGS
jgi:hypothetical protein